MSQTDMHRFLAKGSTGGEDGEAASAFEGTLARLGGIKGLAADAEAACEEDADAKPDQEHGEASDGNASEPEPGSGRKRKSSNRSNPSSDGRKPKVPKLWVEKELKVAAATRAQQAWRKGHDLHFVLVAQGCPGLGCRSRRQGHSGDRADGA